MLALKQTLQVILSLVQAKFLAEIKDKKATSFWFTISFAINLNLR